MNTQPITSLRVSDSTYRVKRGEQTIGHVEVWHESDRVNSTGIKWFASRPLCGAANLRCRTYSAAVQYLLEYEAWPAVADCTTAEARKQ